MDAKWSENIVSTRIRILLPDALSDNVFSYSDMLNIFQATADGGFSATELDDLHYIFSQDVFENDYVKTITQNIIFPNEGNRYWWGGVKDASDIVALGDVGPGTTEVQANLYIDKWFLGKDLPMPISGGDTANPAATSGKYDYGKITGPLFVDGITEFDVNQGAAGTCYLIASMESIAAIAPGIIEQAFIVNPNGTYGVKFYFDGEPIYTTVNNGIPVNYWGEVNYAGNLTGDLSGEAWVSLMEKAYVQANAQVNLKYSNEWSKALTAEYRNSYLFMEGGLADTLGQITGDTYDAYSYSNWSWLGEYQTLTNEKDPSKIKQELIEALAEGGIGWLGSWGTSFRQGEQVFTYERVGAKLELIAGHAHALHGYDAETDTFIISNPWTQSSAYSPYNTTFQLPLEFFWTDHFDPLIAITNPSADPVGYTYTLSPSLGSEDWVVYEGDDIQFVIERDGSGTKSTVYLSTSHQSTSNGDIIELTKLPVVFSANETTKTMSISTLGDELSEGDETFSFNLYSSLYTVAPDATQEITLKDKSSGFDYALSVSGANGDGNFVEGSDVVVTVTRDGSGSASTIYLSATGATASADDFETLNYHAVEFSSKETTKKITVSTFFDEKVEGEETVRFELFANPGANDPLSSTIVSIADSWDPEYNYIIYSNASLESAAIEEGGEITFTVIRSGTGASSTVYAKPFYNNAMANDLVDIGNLELHFSKNELQKVFTVDIAEDLWLETTESFGFKVYNSAFSTTAMSQGVAYIKDKVFDEYEYTLSSGDTEPLSVDEGSYFSLEIGRNGTGSVSEVFVSTRHGTTNFKDFAAINRQEVIFNQKDALKIIQIETFSDDVADNEFFWVDLYLNENDLEPAYSEKVTLNDVEQLQTYEYEVSTAEVSEGDVASFTVTRDGSGEASTVWVATTEYTADDTDYASLKLTGVTFSAKETSKTISIQTYVDQADEGSEPEIFWLDLFRSEADYFSGNYAAYGIGYIDDLSLSNEADFTYEIASLSGNSVSEGSVETFVITRSGSGSASSVYVSTIDGSADGDDYGAISLQKIEFNAKETTKTVDVKTYSDTLSEEGEYFYVVLFDALESTYSGDYVVWDYTYIEDNSAPVDVTYTYSVNDVSVTEGETATFSITRDSVQTASAIYVSTSDYTADQTDLKALSAQKVMFSAGELTKTVSVQTYTDSLDEGYEFFYLDVFTSEADAFGGWNYAAWGLGTITDGDGASEAVYSYSVDSVSVVEGETATFTITRDGSETVSHVYVNTSEYSADAYDMNSLYAYKVSFEVGETSKTVSVGTYTDSVEEGDELFYVDLFATEVDALDGWDYIAWGQGTIVDGNGSSGTSYTYSVDSVSVVEGETATFTIMRDTDAAASLVYVNTSVYSADADDIYVLSAYEVNFLAGELSKTVSVQTYVDTLEEGKEYYYLDVFASEADALAGLDYIAWGTGSILDGEIEVDASYDYSVEGTTVSEGDTVSFTIIRNGSSTSSTVYVNTTSYTADATDFDFITAKPVNFAVGESIKTVNVQTFGDGLVEGTETFYLDVFASVINAISGENFIAWGTGSIEDAVGFVDVVYDYAVDNTDVIEGETAVFTITRYGSSTSSTVYLSTSTYQLLDASDMTFLSAQPLTFDIGETSKTVSISTYADGEEEGTQTYYLDVYASEADALQGSGYIAWGKGTIADGSSTFAFASVSQKQALSANAFEVFGSSLEPDVRLDRAPLEASSQGDVANDSVGALNANEAPAVLVATQEIDPINTFYGHDGKGFQNAYAFAALNNDGTVTAWGDPDNGGAALNVSGALVDVSAIYSTHKAFAALKDDGSVVVWGNSNAGGEAGALSDALNGETNVTSIASTQSAFAALREDGSVIAWGSPGAGGTYPEGQGLSDVVDIYSNLNAFAALTSDGKIISWGQPTFGGDQSDIPYNPDAEFTEVYSTASAFAAIRADGSVYTWGNAADGGDSTTVAGLLSGLVNVTSISATTSAFAAVRADGSVVTWGNFASGADSSKVADNLDGRLDVIDVFSTDYAFAALRSDGSVVTWGNPLLGGDSASVSDALDGSNPVEAIYSNGTAFVALHRDETLTAWGLPGHGGDMSSVTEHFTSGKIIAAIEASQTGFAALFEDGSFVTWGDFADDDRARIETLTKNVTATSLSANHSAFYVLDQTGGISAWGDLSEGGFYVAPAEDPQSVFDMSADLAIVQRGIVGKGVGKDSYIISSNLVQAQEQITITDTGENVIQFIEGLEVLSGKVAASAMLLTLGNGAQLTVLDAQNYTYVVGGSALEDIAGENYTFQEFVSSVLGSEVPLSGLATVAGSVVGGGVALQFGSVQDGEDTVVLQRGIVGKGAGSDTYIVSNAPLESAAEITLTDTGDNTLHLFDGLTIASSMVAANALMLTLENDTTLTVLGASEYSYTVGGDPISGVTGVVLEYAAFTEQVLGVSLPVGSAISTGGASTVRSGDILSVDGAPRLGSTGASNQADYGFLRDAVTETLDLVAVPDLASAPVEII